MYPKNVFVNCPFDDHYFPILTAVLFTICYLDLEPQISGTSDSGATRINTITNLMKDSLYSIHDLSRMEPLKKKEFPRFNMPFECGIDFGIKFSSQANFATKKFLILESERYRYQKVISDISGNDIYAHQNQPEMAVRSIRNWFRQNLGEIPMDKEIWGAFNEFTFDYETILNRMGYDPQSISAIPFRDTIDIMKKWISDSPAKDKSLVH